MAPHDPTWRPRTLRRLLGLSFVCALVVASLGLPRFAPLLPSALAEEAPGPAGSSAATLAPLPARMARTGGAGQLIVATGRRLGSTTGTLQFFELVDGAWECSMSVPCRLGKRGLMNGTKRKAGNKTTPTGIWAMQGFVFGTHVRAPSGTKMSYRRITWKSWWSSKKGRTYNRWVEARRWRGERLANAPKAYEYAVATGFNQRPNRCVYGRGSGIFLHINGRGLTSGCVSISRSDMIRVCTLLDPAKHPSFAIGTLATGTPTSILAY